MPHFTHLLLGQILIERHAIPAQAIDLAISTQAKEGKASGRYRLLGEYLLDANAVTPDQLTAALSFQQEQFASSLIGPYRLESLLGRGGVGTVYRAIQLGAKKEPAPVAVKLIPQKHPGDVAALARFQSEAQAGAALDHPHIVRTLDFGTTRDCYYLVCELMPGGTLLDRINKNGTFSEADTLALAIALLQALDHAHHRGLMHRDIKPANILYDAADAPRLADLGLARSIAEQKDGSRAQNAVGTPAFMAPEQAIGPERCDARADLYSLGATLFYVLAGAPPFAEKKSLAVINQHLNEAPPDLQIIRQTLSISVVAFIRKLMAKRPDDRYANAAEAIADIRRIQNDERPLALALTAEQAYAPLKVTLQTRDNASDMTPASGKKNVSDHSESNHSGKEAGQATNPTSTTRPFSRTPAATLKERTPSGNKIPMASSSPSSAANKKITTDRINKTDATTPTTEPISPRTIKRNSGTTVKPAEKAGPSSTVKKSTLLIASLGIIFLGFALMSFALLSHDKTPTAQENKPNEISTSALPALTQNNPADLNLATQTIASTHFSTQPPSKPVSNQQQNTPATISTFAASPAEKNNSPVTETAQEIDILALMMKPDFKSYTLSTGATNWKFQENGLLVSDNTLNKDLISFPVILPLEYDLTCTFKRVDVPAELKKMSTLAILFPIKDSRCTFIVRGESYTRVGVETIDDKSANENGSNLKTHLPFDHKFTVTLQVRATTLTVYLDKKRIFMSPIEGHKFELLPFWSSKSKYAFGIGSSKCIGEISQLLIKGISGPVTVVDEK
jgi:serine/threonine protein kinase